MSRWLLKFPVSFITLHGLAATHANEYPYMNGLFAIGEFEFNKKDKEFQQLLNKILSDFTKNG